MFSGSMSEREYSTKCDYALGRALATVGLFKDALVVPGDTAFAGWSLLCTNALHLESATYCACSRTLVSREPGVDILKYGP